MFGESDSESPRVPSPWDFLISPSHSRRPSPLSRSPNNSAANLDGLTIDSIPRLVPENDEGNVEYKLQLLNPSPARFARLVTQLKWRLLEGGGQAYYELGVADSGALVGLPRTELEQSLETLEMMAGEIGASVIVVKEIEVPAVMAGIAATQTDTWNGRRQKRAHVDLRGKPGSDEGSGSSSTVQSWTSTSEAESEPSSTDPDPGDQDDLSMTILLDNTTRHPYQTVTPRCTASIPVFTLDPDPDPADNADAEPDEDFVTTVFSQSYVSINLEIATVFKPRPMRARMHPHLHARMLGSPTTAKTKRLKKIKHITHLQGHQHQPDQLHNRDDPHNHDHQRKEQADDGEAVPEKHHVKSTNKALTRRQMRDRKREEKRRALVAFATAGTNSNGSPEDNHCTSTSAVPNASCPPEASSVLLESQVKENISITPASETSALVSGLAGLHVAVQDPEPVVEDSKENAEAEGVDEDDVFTPPTPAKSFPDRNRAEGGDGAESQSREQPRLIVEALVVRKMSLDEAFLDFGGFALICN